MPRRTYPGRLTQAEWLSLSDGRVAFWADPPAPEQILEDCAEEWGAQTAVALRRAFRLERKRHARTRRPGSK